MAEERADYRGIGYERNRKGRGNMVAEAAAKVSLSVCLSNRAGRVKDDGGGHSRDAARSNLGGAGTAVFRYESPLAGGGAKPHSAG